MFTGIIRNIGTIVSSTRQEDGSVFLEIQAPFSAELSEGDSVAVAGACLTVLTHTDTTWTCYLMAETLDKTTLGKLMPGDKVNLEQPAKAGDFLHGHIVQGHVDGVCKIITIQKHGDDSVITFQPPKELLKHIVSKGSVTLDGVSLTVVDVLDNSFTVSLMPYTLAHTTFQHKTVGDEVHIETDKGHTAKWFSGTAQKGDGRGTSLGFPTANITLNDASIVLPIGVFAARAMIQGDPTMYGAALHSGPRPTFSGASNSVELHLINFAPRNLYNETMHFTIIEKVADIQKFDSVDALKEKIKDNVKKATEILLEPR
ncbi:MAG TPA: riboflavin synthase [Candidatus Andersenbacteria bacterium]|nr:riboflavin synthase [Candidatus Andersenbacteria bacterium]